MILKAIITGMKNNMKYHNMTLIEAFKEELYMMNHIMGFKLYVKYMNGMANEGIDFTTCE